MIVRSAQKSNRRAAEAEDGHEQQGELKQLPIRFPVIDKQFFAMCDIMASDQRVQRRRRDRNGQGAVE